MAIKRTSHAVYDTSYHLVWCPKYRKKIFEREDIRERPEQLIREISEQYGFEIIEMKVAVEHVDILLSFPRGMRLEGWFELLRATVRENCSPSSRF